MNNIRFILLIVTIALGNSLYSQDSDCNNPTPIALPFGIQSASTCNTGNDLTTSPCSNSLFLATEDLFFAYQSDGQECISIALTNVMEGTGMGVYYGCPDTANTCLAQAGGVPGTSDVSIESVFLPWPGTYYLVVDNAIACTDFDLAVERLDCPVVFPPSANCGQAISMNGCSEIINDLRIAAGEGDPGFIQNGVNNGCWDGSFPLNYTWFSFRAASAGQFAFTLSAQNAQAATDLDFQIWGPVSTEDSLCIIAAGSQPVRSSFAAGEEPTGLAAIHPVLNIPVTDFCEDASGDDFVAPLEVQPGEWYLVLVNDWGGGLANGAVSIDFSATGNGVLGESMMEPSAIQDTLICPGDSVRLWASGGLYYQWISEDVLSCIYCPKAIAEPDSSQTFSVVITSLCRTDTLFATVGFYEEPLVSAGPDTLVCGLNPVALTASANSNGNFLWLPDSITGNSYSPVPQAGTNIFVATFQDDTGCFEVRDTVMVEWLGELPVQGIELVPDDTVYLGMELLIKPDTLPGGLEFNWNEPLISNEDSILFIPDSEGSYEVALTVADSNGCEKTINSVFVVLPIRIDIPNVFTPNSDEYNQTFGPVIAGDGVELLSLKIWNRWGELVHRSTGATGWDGRHSGEPAAADTYIYRMELKLPSGKIIVRTGAVTLLR